MKVRFGASLLTLLLAATFSVGASGPATTQVKPEQVDAHVTQRVIDQDVALAMAPIKSRRQLEAHLQAAKSTASPLLALEPAARKRFLDSITFNDKGITGFSYTELQSRLTASQVYKILSLFGAQHTTSMVRGVRRENALDMEIMSPVDGPRCPSQPCDYEGYRCEGRATCAPNINTICMRNC